MRITCVKSLSLISTLLLAACCGCHDKQAATPGGALHGHGASAPVAATAKLNENGYIRDWLVLGPINFGTTYNAEEIDKEQVPNEGGLAPNAGDKVKVKSQTGEGDAAKMVDTELTWRKVVTTDFLIDFNEVFALDITDAMGAYAVAYLDAPEEIKGITFSLSTNDDGVIYLNGKKIFSMVIGRPLAEDSDVVEDLTLKQGTNVVVFKVWNDTNAWQGCIRLLDKAGKPVTNVRVRSAK